MIVAETLSKRYGDKTAMDGFSFSVQPGVVTGFLGPNGAGKSTMMRMIVGLDAPTSGSVTVNGRRYAEFNAPMAGQAALEHRILLHHLATQRASLEEAFMELTHDAIEYHTDTLPGQAAATVGDPR